MNSKKINRQASNEGEHMTQCVLSFILIMEQLEFVPKLFNSLKLNLMNNYYVCVKFGCISAGTIDSMFRDDDYYPENSTWYFKTEDDADDKIEELITERGYA